MNDQVQVLDVRAPDEWESGVIAGSCQIYAPHLATGLPADLDKSKPVLIGCETGYRASLAASILQREGYLPEVLVGAGLPEVIAAI
jgi:rhodanese-related sulfurtransferase